jgi:hypothetical protein
VDLITKIEKKLTEIFVNNKLNVSYENGSIVLRGITPDYYRKQLAQHSAMKVSGSIPIVNKILVQGG